MARQYVTVPDQQLVSCEVCLKSIPVSEARSAETEDYVAYFCGLDCYDLWIKQNPQSGQEKTEPQK
jgi:hypothetical protein